MNEQKISYKTARLAKELGFNVPVYSAYVNFYEQHLTEKELKRFGLPKIEFVEFQSFAYEGALNTKVDILPKHNFNDMNSFYSAPTQCLLQKWLREKHNLHIEVKVSDKIENTKYYWSIFGPYKGKHIMCLVNSGDNTDEYYPTYEKALETALYEALKLIKQKITQQ